ncbi:p-cumate dioxygenase OS=Streptomyces alboniger OX=132473 GN=CP975_33970 PE=3 SV=1 [Streptomyces alboniger]|uniref:Aromatic-ring-hydroxylating dioxygenase subunit beta n=1 Tax=Streptomyces ureilyticus TaxID=1775131 RepID=A0ABX0DQ81_9ACTN|nr:aromatic-ring-hydroxylating dioxygenase subunit beta [Streptomyces ureilyticus]NGO43530.1 aromatic-ring-hydroxylating dioxygenase subunit beta [Streptomyces ureilyticus]WSZ19092.1 aromatic-ring-hydroxylating dioxygenase subunit beta [Streptomyces canus]WSZ29533.1 aromatic-ring-hydroxylating dioxygenase subunit beta [Streptomyces sp. NBC_00882]WSZ63604.1 aromatic-ring-hydroxylating dioxygenase subunit beta [Streptomyces canus]
MATQAPTPPIAPANVPDSLVRSVERYLYEEAELLDTWRLHEWLELFAPHGQYQVPSTDKPDGDPARDLFLIQDDRFLLEQRVNSLLTRAAHAEYPHSRTRHLITNVRVTDATDGRLTVTANFAVYRVRSGTVDTYVGQYRHILLQDEDGSFRYELRKSVLDLDALHPHGKVSVIL